MLEDEPTGQRRPVTTRSGRKGFELGKHVVNILKTKTDIAVVNME